MIKELPLKRVTGQPDFCCKSNWRYRKWVGSRFCWVQRADPRSLGGRMVEDGVSVTWRRQMIWGGDRGKLGCKASRDQPWFSWKDGFKAQSVEPLGNLFHLWFPVVWAQASSRVCSLQQLGTGERGGPLGSVWGCGDLSWRLGSLMGSSLLPHPAVLESLLTEQFRLMVRQPLTSSFRLFRQILGLEFGYWLISFW